MRKSVLILTWCLLLLGCSPKSKIVQFNKDSALIGCWVPVKGSVDLPLAKSDVSLLEFDQQIFTITHNNEANWLRSNYDARFDTTYQVNTLKFFISDLIILYEYTVEGDSLFIKDMQHRTIGGLDHNPTPSIVFTRAKCKE